MVINQLHKPITLLMILTLEYKIKWINGGIETIELKESDNTKNSTNDDRWSILEQKEIHERMSSKYKCSLIFLEKQHRKCQICNLEIPPSVVYYAGTVHYCFPKTRNFRTRLEISC